MVSSDLEQVRETVTASLSEIFGSDSQAIAEITQTMEKVRNGDVKTPIHFRGVAESLERIQYCANEAHQIMVDMSNAAQGEAQVNPVTG